MPELKAPTRRERQREATYDEIVRVASELLAEDAELSLRAIASRMGMTAPALYRYVANYQELVDLVAFELDRAMTENYMVPAAERYPADQPGARIAAGAVAFRRWAISRPREFQLVFNNPISSIESPRRELLTLSTSGHFFTELLNQIYDETHYDFPALDDLEPAVREAVLDPLIPAKADHIPREERGRLWIYMQSWSALYGVVTLESSGHCDPRVLEAGSLFRATLTEWLPKLGLADRRDELTAVLDAELARTE